MKRSLAILGLLSLPLIFISGCNTSPTLSGDIIGYVKLFDINSTHLTSDSGVTVSLEGTNITTTSAADGKYVLSGIDAGTYTIDYFKTGYGTYKRPGTQFVGGGQILLGITYLDQAPLFTVTNLLATTSTDGSVNLTGTFVGSLPTNNRFTFVFVGTSPNVSSDPANYVFAYSTSNTSTTFSGSLAYSTFYAYGLVSGETVYIVAYGAPSGTDDYTDFVTGRNYYSNLSSTASNVVTVTVP